MAPPAKRILALAIEIIALVAELAPKVIGAGKFVVDLWQSAGGIIAAPRFNVLVDANLASRDRNTRKAKSARAVAFYVSFIPSSQNRYGDFT